MEKRRQAANRVLRGSFVMVPAALAVFVVRDYAGWRAGGDMFRLTDVEVTGSFRVRPDEIPALAAITPGTSIFAFDAAELSRAISRHPWIRRATVAKTLPHRLDVEIEERQPIAIVLAGPDLVQIDAEGVLLPTRGGMVADDLPMITGAVVPRPIPFGTHEPDAPWTRAAVFLAGLEAIRDSTGDPALRISELHVDKDAGEFSVMEEGGRYLRFSADELGAKFPELFQVLGELASSDLIADYVDLRFRDQVIVGGARPRPAEADSTPGPEGDEAG